MPLHYHHQGLDKLLKHEQKYPSIQPLPSKLFFEIGFLLKYNTKKLADLRNIRFDKVMKQLDYMTPSLLSLGPLTSYEVQLLRPLVVPMMTYLSHSEHQLPYHEIKSKYNALVSEIEE